jgi:tRNA threonylcarbamoyl adenosine modification protein (Sua5/YciO/YrdC/YwlC family)
MKRLLPGPYTFILEGSKLVPRIMLTKRKTAGIRVPDHQICLSLTEALGNPILSTSATMPDGEILMDPSLIHDRLNLHLDMVIDGGTTPGGPSSVISLMGDYPEVLREGLGDIGSLE